MKALRDFLQVRSLQGLKVVVDPMHGAGAGYLSGVLSELGAQVVEIRGERNPLFDGVHPEPLDSTTKRLQQEMVAQQAHAGFILDGDADRIGARDETGEFLDSHRIFSLLLKHLVERRHERGKVMKTVSTTDMIGLLSERYGVPCETTPVGFKHVCNIMMRESGTLMGGEESGGIGFSRYLPERDGALCALLLAEALVMSKELRLSQHVSQLLREVGPHFFRRVDVGTPPGQAMAIVERMLKQPPKEIGSRTVAEVIRLDGIKLRFGDGMGWMMLRGSGTEPLLRLYVEANSVAAVDALVRDAQTYAKTFM
jgi:phosphomannomutase